MLRKIEAWATPRRRKWAYGLVGALVAVLVTYRVLDGDQAASWLYLAAMALGMATVKTDASTPSGMPASESADTGPTADSSIEGTAGIGNE